MCHVIIDPQENTALHMFQESVLFYFTNVNLQANEAARRVALWHDVWTSWPLPETTLARIRLTMVSHLPYFRWQSMVNYDARYIILAIRFYLRSNHTQSIDRLQCKWKKSNENVNVINIFKRQKWIRILYFNIVVEHILTL